MKIETENNFKIEIGDIVLVSGTVYNKGVIERYKVTFIKDDSIFLSPLDPNRRNDSVFVKESEIQQMSGKYYCVLDISNTKVSWNKVSQFGEIIDAFKELL